jgi:CRP-like cAMP-binding protein
VDTFDSLEMNVESLAQAIQHRFVDVDMVISSPDNVSGRTFYHILKGTAKAYFEALGTTVQLPERSSFGDVQIDENELEVNVHESHVIATSSPTEVLIVEKDVYEKAMLWKNVELMMMIPLFKHWSKNRIAQLARNLRPLMYPPGAIVIHQGDKVENPEVYFISKGECLVQKEVRIVRRNRWPNSNHEWTTCETHLDKAVNVRKLTEGDFFGEIGCLFGKPRACSVRAKTTVHLVSMPREDFVGLVKGNRETLMYLQQNSDGYEGDDQITELYHENHNNTCHKLAQSGPRRKGVALRANISNKIKLKHGSIRHEKKNKISQETLLFDHHDDVDEGDDVLALSQSLSPLKKGKESQEKQEKHQNMPQLNLRDSSSMPQLGVDEDGNQLAPPGSAGRSASVSVGSATKLPPVSMGAKAEQ